MVRQKTLLSDKILFNYLHNARVARLATVNPDGTAHVVPIVFANDHKRIYFVIDKKPKGPRLRRVFNIERTKKATILVDKFSEDWKKLSFAIIYCDARTLSPGKDLREKMKAARLLKAKYRQYGDGRYFPENVEQTLFIQLTPARYYSWPKDRAHF